MCPGPHLIFNIFYIPTIKVILKWIDWLKLFVNIYTDNIYTYNYIVNIWMQNFERGDNRMLYIYSIRLVTIFNIICKCIYTSILKVIASPFYKFPAIKEFLSFIYIIFDINSTVGKISRIMDEKCEDIANEYKNVLKKIKQPILSGQCAAKRWPILRWLLVSRTTSNRV